MNKNVLILIPIVVVLVLASIGFFYPKEVGGNLCGPVCPSRGLHYYKQGCLGIDKRYTAIDASWTICYGLPIGEKKCYGVPYTEPEEEIDKAIIDRELDCNYPCNDEDVRGMCQNQEAIIFETETFYCAGLRKKCNW